jgi:MscS family membrane protein
MSKFNDLLSSVLNQGIIGIDLLNIIIIFIVLLFSLIIRGFFAKIIIKKIKKIVTSTNNNIDDTLLEGLSSPLKFFPIVLAFFYVSLYVDLDTNLGFYFEKINKSLLTVFIFWLLHASLSPFSFFFHKLENFLTKPLVFWIIKSLKYLILFLGLVATLDIWGIKIGPIVAGLGLFGVAVALGAQDLFKNLISGLLILMERRFTLGDVINVPGHAEGTVEQIGFRSTTIRKFDSNPITIPNYIIADLPIINYSNRSYRRINWVIGLVYDTSTDQLKKIIQDTTKFITTNNDFQIDDSHKCYVRVEKFNDSSIDILVCCFTKTNDWNEYLVIKEQLIFELKKIIENNNSSFAFPSHSIYLEKND